MLLLSTYLTMEKHIAAMSLAFGTYAFHPSVDFQRMLYPIALYMYIYIYTYKPIYHTALKLFIQICLLILRRVRILTHSRERLMIFAYLLALRSRIDRLVFDAADVLMLTVCHCQCATTLRWFCVDNPHKLNHQPANTSTHIQSRQSQFQMPTAMIEEYEWEDYWD